jgi:hypothetical protein
VIAIFSQIRPRLPLIPLLENKPEEKVLIGDNLFSQLIIGLRHLKKKIYISDFWI